MDIGFRARVPHEILLPLLDLDIALEEGEQLRVEVSTKFRRERIEPELRDAGLRVESWWTDARADFAVAMVRP
jgi:L-histidine N-alpha-methyltransferase